LNAAGAGEGQARAAAFVALVSGHLSLAAATLATRNRSAGGPHWRIFLVIAAAATALIGAMLTVPTLLQIMRFVTPSAANVLAGLAVGLLAGGWYSARLLFAAGARAKAPSARHDGPMPTVS